MTIKAMSYLSIVYIMYASLNHIAIVLFRGGGALRVDSLVALRPSIPKSHPNGASSKTQVKVSFWVKNYDSNVPVNYFYI